MDCRKNQIQYLWNYIAKREHGKNIHAARQRRLKRNRLILGGICMMLFFSLSLHFEYAAQENMENETAHNIDTCVEAAADVQGISTDAGRSLRDTEKIPKNDGMIPKDMQKSSKDTQKSPKDTQKGAKDTQKSPKDTQKGAKDTQKSPKDTQKGAKDTMKIPKTPKIDKSAWNLTLVNKSHPIAKGYIPNLADAGNGHAVDSRICQSLKDMLAAAEKEGLSPMICSSYRSEAAQTELFEAEVNEDLYQGVSREEAKKRASSWVAPPGTSEHQLGLAVDLVSQSYQMLDQAQENTAEQKWLIKNCAKYGFILRYPTNKSKITGVGYEPWHYRYVGKDAAKEIMDRQICLEEYLDTK